MPSSCRRNHSCVGPLCGAFTLTELVIVVGVIAFLASIVVPAASMVRSSAKSSQCMANQRQLVSACTAYVAEHRGWLPSAVQYDSVYWDRLISPYLESTMVYNWGGTYNEGSFLQGCPAVDGRTAWEYGINPAPMFPTVSRWNKWDQGSNAAVMNAAYWSSFRMTAITRPAQRVYFADAITYLVDPMFQPGKREMPRHRNHAALSYFDGHAGLVAGQAVFIAAERGD